MSCVMPDGRVHEGHVVWGDLSKGSVLSKGYAVQFPDLSASDDQAFTDLESDIRLMLGSLKADERLQLQFYTSSDLSGPLNRFVEDTRANSKVEICSKVRDELAFRYRGRIRCAGWRSTAAPHWWSPTTKRGLNEAGPDSFR